MATAEPAPSSLGPRYAPDDPTLPKPWKGLIDGSTGLLYYWNPETNITQYEKPTALPPPLPPGPPPAAATPKLAPIPAARTMQTNGSLAHHGQQMNQAQQQQGQQMMQTSQQQGQQMSQFPQQHGQLMSQQQGPQMAQSVQQPGPQFGQALQQQGQLTPQQLGQQIVQHPGQQMLSQSLQQMPQQPSQQLPQQLGPQTPQLLGQQTPQHAGSQMAQPQVHQYAHQQMQYNVYQQHVPPPGQQNSQQQTQHIAQGPPFQKQQEFKTGFPQREEIDFHQGSQVGFSPSQIQQTGTSSAQNMPAGVKSFQMPQSGGQTGQAQPFSGPSVSMQQQHDPRFQNQMGPGMMHSQQPNIPPAGLKRGYDENPRGTAGNDYYFSANKEVPLSVSQQPKLAAIPSARNPQEMRMGGVPVPNVPPGHAGGLNAVAGQAMHNMYSHATGGTGFSNNALMRPPSMMIGSSDISTLSPVEVYCQQHEVTATGENVPPPLMTFEATGFPPEILREVRYLLQKEEHMSYAALLFAHIHAQQLF